MMAKRRWVIVCVREDGMFSGQTGTTGTGSNDLDIVLEVVPLWAIFSGDLDFKDSDLRKAIMTSFY